MSNAAAPTKEDLIAEVKRVMGFVKEGKLAEAYGAYRALFSRPDFGAHALPDQRQALKLMIYAKGVPQIPTQPMIEAHRAAAAPLTELVSAHGEPADHEMLGICHHVMGNDTAAGAIFKAGLDLERARNPQSNLCGSLMKWVSAV